MSVRVVSLLLFVSGLCALVFQTAWLREFRLIFGASTPASAAVLAIFMGGLGLGNALLGKRADAAANPLRMYGQLELAISVAAGLSPFLVQIVRGLYIAVGGQETLGVIGATVVRLLLSAVVIGVPTFLMGGTLPAAARAVTTPDDQGRRDIGWLYGLNTLGAVVGALLATFALLELLGTRETLWFAAALNMVNGAVAWRLAAWWREAGTGGQGAGERSQKSEVRGQEKRKERKKQELVASTVSGAEVGGATQSRSRFLYLAAGIVGFAFFLMELVWYRMLGPILGGTTFTFGLILAVALAGIGIGGALYPVLYSRRAPTLRDFALTCGWESLAIAIPFALGDRIALVAYILQGLRYFGFAGQTLGWAVVAIIVVFPAAVVSGIQFPLLISLLGQGGRDVGKHVGTAFAWNTVGAMVGSLAGGFGLLPLLSALGAWKLVVIVLALLALATLYLALRGEGAALSMLHPALAATAAAACLLAMGPTAVWRHSGIGAGRARPPAFASATRNDLKDWMNDRRRNIAWEVDGAEVSVAIATGGGVAFLVSGKSDGNAANDAGTQIMFPVLAAMLHPNPQESLVIGLGTGESAGWLAALPSMQRVDVVELEPAIAAVAAAAAPLNHDVLRHPKVHVSYNDAREVVQTTRRKYDLIASEPSNPYRAGVASLYTLEFYKSVLARLKPGGVFAQWVQGYEIDVPTVRIVLGTLRRVFAHVEIWEAKPGDMMLVCSAERPDYDLARLRQRLETPGYREAVRIGWRTNQVEGILAHFVANETFVDTVANQERSWPSQDKKQDKKSVGTIAKQERSWLNQDNQNLLEYSFARTVGLGLGFSVFGLREEARSRDMHRPTAIQTGVEWDRVEDRIVDYNAVVGDAPLTPQFYAGKRRDRAQALHEFFYYNGTRVIEHWQSLGKPPEDIIEVFALAFGYAQAGDEKARPLIEQLRATSRTEAMILEALLLHQQDRYSDAAEHLSRGLVALRSDPTVMPRLGEPMCKLALQIVEKDPKQAPKLYDALSQPFSIYWGNEQRLHTRYLVGKHIGHKQVADAMSHLEPHVPWGAQYLRLRMGTYAATKHPLADRARRDWETFERGTPEYQVLTPVKK